MRHVGHMEDTVATSAAATVARRVFGISAAMGPGHQKESGAASAKNVHALTICVCVENRMWNLYTNLSLKVWG